MSKKQEPALPSVKVNSVSVQRTVQYKVKVDRHPFPKEGPTLLITEAIVSLIQHADGMQEIDYQFYGYPCGKNGKPDKRAKRAARVFVPSGVSGWKLRLVLAMETGDKRISMDARERLSRNEELEAASLAKLLKFALPDKPTGD